MDKVDNIAVEALNDARFVKPYRFLYSQNGVEKSWELISVHASVSILIFNTDNKKVVLVKQFRPAVYFSHYPRNVREIQPVSPSAAASSASTVATQSSEATLSSQQTQTAHKIVSSQETQTVGAVVGKLSNDPDSCQSNQSTQVDVVGQCHQSTQSSTTTTSDSCNSTCSSNSGSLNGSRKLLPNLPSSLGITLELCAGIVDKDGPLRDIAKEEVLEECGYDVPAQQMEEVITYRTGVGASGGKGTLFYVEVTNASKVGKGGGLESEGELIEVVELSIPEVKELFTQREVMGPPGLLFALMWFLSNKAPNYT